MTHFIHFCAEMRKMNLYYLLVDSWGNSIIDFATGSLVDLQYYAYEPLAMQGIHIPLLALFSMRRGHHFLHFCPHNLSA